MHLPKSVILLVITKFLDEQNGLIKLLIMHMHVCINYRMFGRRSESEIEEIANHFYANCHFNKEQEERKRDIKI